MMQSPYHVRPNRDGDLVWGLSAYLKSDGRMQPLDFCGAEIAGNETLPSFR
jgi:hypothetical protein